ncbi:MAG: alpha-amylase family glycosyl hydrolase [Polyangiaceae bacterium]
MIRRVVSLFAAVAITVVACGDNSASSNVTTPGSDGGPSAITEAGPNADAGDQDSGIPDVVSCETTFRYLPAAGTTVGKVAVTGEWNAFDNTGSPLTGPSADGSYTGSVTIPAAAAPVDSDQPGLIGYKLLVDGNYILDPAGRYRKYVGGVENSAIRVADCHVPQLAMISKTSDRPAAGQGHFTARVKFVDATESAGIDPTTVKATLRKDGVETPATAHLSGAEIELDAAALSDGKYSLFVNASDQRGKAAHALRLVFWIESEAYDWRDTVIYMGVTDRVKDGDPSNDAAKTSGIDSRVDFQGGDYEGIRQMVADGTLDQLGIRAIWLTPFNTNPSDSFPASDGVHQTMGYHGYWPTKAREVDARFGGAAELHALITEAHAHGIRILQDFVVNHVHQENAYFADHPDWFRTGCLCGTDNCDWTVHRLDCLFASYLPDVNWTVPAVSDQYIADTRWWMDQFDLDGFRFDAVKHVEDAATLNLTSAIRDEFEASGTKVFLTGETAMGWNNCGLACNGDQYGTIAHYIGDPTKGGGGLDGQFDFVTYYAVPTTVWDKDNGNGLHMPHADYWTQAAGWEYPAGAIMSQYIGSQDTARSVTISSYRGQDGAHDPSIPGNQWTNTAAAPPDEESYQRQRMALTWLLTTPGAPMIYYGDEYAEWGGSDPNNRVMWNGAGALNTDETSTLAWSRKLGTARKNLVALRRGDYEPVLNTDETNLVFARVTADRANAVLVAMTLSTTATTFSASLPPTSPLSNGTVLHDRLGGPDVTVTGGAVSLSLAARGAAILAP